MGRSVKNYDKSSPTYSIYNTYAILYGVEHTP